MFYYTEKIRLVPAYERRDAYTERLITISDGARRVGTIQENRDISGAHVPCDFWHREKPVLVEYFDFNDGRSCHIDYCRNVAEGKKIFAEWYAQNKSKFSAAASADVKRLPASPDSEFYPTPSALAGRMAQFIDWKGVCNILEPSAGKGDLIQNVLKCAQKRTRNWRDEHFLEMVDCVEIDENLRHILDGKGYRVVHDDFLTFTGFKHYDLIVMNPPFSNGDEHLLKAISMIRESGGQIVCLLNAETIRNPYTNRRKLLKELLSELNAKIEFVQNAFARAERPSRVEVAIIYINAPAPVRKSSILEGLKRAAEQKINEEGAPKAIVAGDWLDQMVSGYEMEAKAGIALMEEFNALAPYIMSGTDEYAKPLIQLSVGKYEVDHASSDTVNTYLRSLRGKYWHQLLSRREITEKLTSSLQREYDGKIDEMRDYDFNRYNVRRVFLEITSQLSRGVEESIEKLFDEFSAKHSWFPECEKNIHYFNGWATNKAHKVGMKVILPINGFYACWNDKKELRAYEFAQKIADIERALNYLDCGDTVSRIDPYSVARTAEARQITSMDFTYFSATFYKKGTCHIKFRPNAAHLIDRLNIFAARKRQWLPPDYGKRRYEDMDEESRSVIDEFQGREEYEKVVRSPEKYIVSPAETMPLLSA